MKSLVIDLSPHRVIATKALATVWPGASFGPLAPLRFVDLPRASLPGPDWVRVRTRLAGICGSNLHLVFIDGSLSVAPAALPGRSPGFLGHEAVGDVVEVGPAVRGLATGDRVAMDGSNDCFSMGIEPPCPPCVEGKDRLLQHGGAQGPSAGRRRLCSSSPPPTVCAQRCAGSPGPASGRW